MNKYNDLEISILSCILQKPSLMEDTILEDKYFIKHKTLWLFMKAFYKKFKKFDITLMCSVCKNEYKLMDYIIWLLDVEPAPSIFKHYEQQLIDLYNESKKERWIINKIYSLANDLYVKSITISEFNDKLNQIYVNADKLFKE